MARLEVRERGVIGAIALVLSLALVATTIRVAGGAYDQGYELQASLSRVGQNLDDLSEVRIRGVRVGRVDRIAVDERGRPVVSLRLDEDVRIPSTATASVQPLSLFGPQVVAIHPGAGEGQGPWLTPGETLPEDAAVTELQDLLPGITELVAAIDPDELESLLAATAAAADELAPRSEGMVRNARELTGVAREHLDDGTRILADLTRIARTFEGRIDQLGEVGEDVHATVPAVLAQRDQLDRLLVATTDAFGLVADLFERHPAAFSELARSLLPALLPPLAALAGDLTALPPFIEVLTVLFGELASVFHITGTVGQRLGAIEAHLTPDLCELVDVLECQAGDP